MIETLNGIFETVNCRQNTSLKLYNNDEAENYCERITVNDYHNVLVFDYLISDL